MPQLARGLARHVADDVAIPQVAQVMVVRVVALLTGDDLDAGTRRIDIGLLNLGLVRAHLRCQRLRLCLDDNGPALRRRVVVLMLRTRATQNKLHDLVTHGEAGLSLVAQVDLVVID